MARVPSFPQRESRALSPIQPDAGLQEWSRWDVDLSTWLVLVGIAILVHDRGFVFPLRRKRRGGPAVIAFRVICFGVMVYNNGEPPARYAL